MLAASSPLETDDYLSLDSTQVPQASLEERVSSGEATVAPTVPVREEQESTGIRQVFPPAAEAQLQAHPSSTAGPTEQQQRTEEDEEKIVEHILKQLTPLVEELVTMEVRRARLGRTDQDDDNEGGQDFRQFQQVSRARNTVLVLRSLVLGRKYGRWIDVHSS